MTKAETNKSNRNMVYKKEEYEEFLKMLKDGKIDENWSIIAEALGVDRETLVRWRKKPEARRAINKGIQEALKGMINAGSDDWRMWRERLKMLGVKDVQHLEQKIDASDDIKDLLNKERNLLSNGSGKDKDSSKD